jgi:peroxiredoxin
LAGFNERLEDFDREAVQIVALSSEDEDGAREMKEGQKLGFPVLYGLDVEAMHDRLGLFVHENEESYLQPAQFILDPAGEVRFSSYSNGAVGRLSAEDALSQVTSIKS